MDVLGIRVDNLSHKEMLAKVNGFLNKEKFHQIATINPEFVLEAQKDEEFKNILNNCDLNIADGVGIKLAFWRFGENLKMRMAGIDLVEKILEIAEKNNFKIFLGANSRGLSAWEEARDFILKKYPKLEITGVNLDKNVTGYELPITDCNIVFCNFGAPYQEKFINAVKNDNIRLAMGVGGSFDYLTGKIPRAPKFMRRMGLEWLWRLIQQPRRIKRIWNAVAIFPIRILFKKNYEKKI